MFVTNFYFLKWFQQQKIAVHIIIISPLKKKLFSAREQERDLGPVFD